MGRASRVKADRKTDLATQAKKTNSGAWVFPAVIVVILVAIVGVIVFYSVSGRKSAPTTTSALSPCADTAGQNDPVPPTTAPVNPGTEADPASLVGKPAPPLSGTDMISCKTVNLSSTKGKPTLVVFWAPWCPHCQRELPSLAPMYKSNGGRWNMMTAATALGQEQAPADFATPAKFAETAGMTMPSIVDVKGNNSLNWKVSGFPQLYFLDANGVVRKAESGEQDPAAVQNDLSKLATQN